MNAEYATGFDRELDSITVENWQNTLRAYPEGTPDFVVDAHFRLQNNVCTKEDDACNICHVFCNVCGYYYDLEDRCEQH